MHFRSQSEREIRRVWGELRGSSSSEGPDVQNKDGLIAGLYLEGNRQRGNERKSPIPRS